MKTVFTKIASLISGSLLIGLIQATDAQAKGDFLRVEGSKKTDDLQIFSIGGFGIDGSAVGHADLSYIESTIDGDAIAIDVGAGLSYHIGATFFAGAGALVGYNWDTNDYLKAYYPEVGIVFRLGDQFGLTVTGKRYYNLSSTDDDENVVMFGLIYGGS